LEEEAAKNENNKKQGYETSDDEEEEVDPILNEMDSPMKRIPIENLDSDTKAQMELEDAIRPRWYIISARSSKRFVWDLIIIAFAIQNGITLPLDIAFFDQVDLDIGETMKSML